MTWLNNARICDSWYIWGVKGHSCHYWSASNPWRRWTFWDHTDTLCLPKPLTILRIVSLPKQALLVGWRYLHGILRDWRLVHKDMVARWTFLGLLLEYLITAGSRWLSVLDRHFMVPSFLPGNGSQPMSNRLRAKRRSSSSALLNQRVSQLLMRG